MKRFIITVENLSEEDENILIEFFKKNGLGWWHWIDNVWLIMSNNKETSTGTLRNEVQELTSSGNTLVLEINKNIDWSGFGPNTEERNMFKWIENSWHKKL